MTPILAHFGHWYIQLLYLAPILLVVVALWVAGWREKRRAKRRPPPDGANRTGRGRGGR